ncbi:MAG TPA: hypothetical protein VFE23_12405 [Usitatibacter sp.]|jgi:hypothetical protein|nr:hypothetical protein [Usitatibacter sp.]
MKEVENKDLTSVPGGYTIQPVVTGDIGPSYPPFPEVPEYPPEPMVPVPVTPIVDHMKY